MKRLFHGLLVVTLLVGAARVDADTLGYADVVIEFFDSGTGPMPGPYGGTISPFGNNFPIPVSLDVVLGDDAGPTMDALSLPTGSFVVVGFTNETIIDGPGYDFRVNQQSAGERAEVYVSSGLDTFRLVSTVTDSRGLDLATIGFSDPVQAVKILGLDLGGGSPGFDVLNVQALNMGLPIYLGDMNFDGNVNGLDVDLFADVLINGADQNATHVRGDMNSDGNVNGLDVDPFVAAVVGGGATTVPEPSTLLLCLVALGVVCRRRRWNARGRVPHQSRSLSQPPS